MEDIYIKPEPVDTREYYDELKSAAVINTEMNINNEPGGDTLSDDSKCRDIIKEVILIKTEYVVTDEHEVKTETNHTAEWENENRDPLETCGTSSTDDISQYNHNTNIFIKEQIDMKSECGDDGEYEKSAAVRDTASGISSSESNEDSESLAIKNSITTRLPHVIRHEPGHSGKQFKCHQCDKTFIWSSIPLDHKLLQTEEKPFKCDKCDKAFSLLSYLHRHRRIHSGERLFKCDQCGKTFVSSKDLIIHKRTHSGERPFKCDQCNKTYARSSILHYHKRLHTNEKPFKCDQCCKTFDRSSKLIEHKRVHSGERPFICDQCDKAFLRAAHLISHKKTHSGERPFKCDQCDKAFSRPSHLAKHKRSISIHSGE